MTDEWIHEDNIIRLTANIDPDGSVWGHDTNIGHVDLIRKLIRKEFEQIRREEREKILNSIEISYWNQDKKKAIQIDKEEWKLVKINWIGERR